MPMQAYDFLVLNQKYNCSLQLGGNEQWSTCWRAPTLSAERAKRRYCMTFTILETSGVKMGKSVRGAFGLTKTRLRLTKFYQYFRNIGDHLVKQYLNTDLYRYGRNQRAYQISRQAHKQSKRAIGV